MPIPLLLAALQSTLITVDDDGPADFADLAPALQAAAEGDTVLVYSGSYGPVLIDRGVEVVAAAGLASPADPQGAGSVAVGGIRIDGLASTSVVRLDGLDVRSNTTSAVDVTNSDGVIWIEDCVVATGAPLTAAGSPSFSPKAGLRVVSSDNVYVRGCELLGSAEQLTPSVVAAQQGLLAIAAQVTLFDSVLRGGGPVVKVSGGSGANLAGSQMFASGCEFVGGPGGVGTRGIFKAPGGNGGHGILCVELAALPPSQVVLRGCTTIGGIPGGTSGLGGEVGVPGLPVKCSPPSTVDGAPGPPRFVEAAGLLVTPGDLSLEVQGVSGDVVLLFVSTAPLATWLLPLDGPQLVNTPWTVLPAGVIDAGGQLTVTIPLPDLPGFVETFHAQSGHITGGGAIIAGGGTAMTVVGL